jgi:hypothetical protein
MRSNTSRLNSIESRSTEIACSSVKKGFKTHETKEIFISFVSFGQSKESMRERAMRELERVREKREIWREDQGEREREREKLRRREKLEERAWKVNL